MYQNLHFAPVARFYVGLKTCMAQLAGLAKPSSLTVMHVCTIDHVARMLGDAPGLLETIIYNDNDLTVLVEQVWADVRSGDPQDDRTPQDQQKLKSFLAQTEPSTNAGLLRSPFEYGEAPIINAPRYVI